jgi:hypothetical protein
LRLAACMSVSALALVRGIGISSGRLSAGYGVPLTALLPPRESGSDAKRIGLHQIVLPRVPESDDVPLE